MSKRNPVYDFKWCPGCGDFGVKVAIEQALAKRCAERGESIEQTAIVAGIGCSGNLVHMQEGPQPFGLHGGSPGKCGCQTLVRAGMITPLAGCTSFAVEAGDRVIIETPGGGGLGCLIPEVRLGLLCHRPNV